MIAVAAAAARIVKAAPMVQTARIVTAARIVQAAQASNRVAQTAVAAAAAAAMWAGLGGGQTEDRGRVVGGMHAFLM